MSPSDISLRPYQEECLAAIPERGAYLIQMATGLGKTVTFSRIPRRGRMLILSHREELVRQPAKYFDCPVGFERAEERSNGEEVVSASVQSLVRRLNKFKPNDFDVIVTDEAHHAIAPTYRKVFNYFQPRLHLGFTATPNRDDGIGLSAIYQDIIFQRDIKWGIENGYLSNIYCLRVNIGLDLSKVAARLGDYESVGLDRAVNIEGLNIAVAEAFRVHAEPPALIFCTSIQHAENLAKLIPGAIVVRGGEGRAETVQAFARGEIPAITNCMVFAEGTDLPNVKTIMIVRPTKNVALYTQMVGRGTRLCEGKKHLTLIDCVGVSEDADLCTAPCLLGLDVRACKDKHLFVGDLFEFEDIAARQMDNPAAWIRNVYYVDLWAKSKRYNLHSVNWFRLPDGRMALSSPKLTLPAEDSLGRIRWNGKLQPAQDVFDEIYRVLKENCKDKRALWDRTAIRQWGAGAASDKQKALIARKLPGFNTANLNKMEAGQILTRCFAR